MKQKIKSRTTFASYYAIAGINAKELEEKTFSESQVLFDENGNILVETKFLPNGKTESMVKLRYDEKGNKTEELHFISADEISEKRTFKYDENNLPVAEFLHYLDGSFDATINVFDENSMLIEKRVYDSENQLESRIKYSYANNLLSETIYFDSEENILEMEIYKRNENGNIIEKIITGSEGKEIFNYGYDESSRVINTRYKNEDENSETQKQFDTNGNISREIFFRNGKLLHNTLFVYDENNLLKEIHETVPAIANIPEQNMSKKVEYEFY